MVLLTISVEHLYEIESMGEADLEAVAAIEEASFPDPWPLDSFRTEYEQNSLAVYYIARSAGQVVAYIGAWHIIDEMHITTFAVAERHRRLGIGTLLVAALIEKARQSGVSSLTLEVRPSNSGAITFYEELGFKTAGRRKRYYNNEDALIMTKDNLYSHDEGTPGPG